MSMKWIREHYGVPAKRGMIIRYRGNRVRITSARHGRLMVRTPGLDARSWPIHPTWEVEYPQETP